jgi:alkylation response protein AidB-like acyl-CoA dehydrogenase
MAEFTMELNDEQKEVRDWLHGFAADVIRPAAAEWDEREETPWPIIQEAARSASTPSTSTPSSTSTPPASASP